MKYSVVHLLSGDAARYHRTLTGELSARFKIAPLHERVAPHITAKPPFEANDYEIQQVEECLRKFTASRSSEALALKGFGRFGFKTAYLNVVKSRRAVELVRECISSLNKLSWMSPIDREGHKLHTSVARYMNYRQFRRVWRFLRTKRPCFATHLDSLAILKKERTNRAWTVYREFELAPHGHELIASQPAFAL